MYKRQGRKCTPALISGNTIVFKPATLTPQAGRAFLDLIAQYGSLESLLEKPVHKLRDQLLATWGIGEETWGGFAQRARVRGGWTVLLPDGIGSAEAMAIGTAGYTAMLCVLALEDHDITPEAGPVLVTGAAGGVGSVAVAVLAARGYEVHASTGRPEEADYLVGLGASEIVDRSELSETGGRPLARARWAGAVDAVGSHTLANVLSQIRPEGCVAACGNAQGTDLTTTVFPFILRGVTLRGVHSVHVPRPRRLEAWRRLDEDLDRDLLASMTRTVGLDDVPAVAAEILAGRVRGRVVVCLLYTSPSPRD